MRVRQSAGTRWYSHEYRIYESHSIDIVISWLAWHDDFTHIHERIHRPRRLLIRAAPHSRHECEGINGIMAYYSPDESLLVFDALPPRQYVGATAFRKDWEGFLAAYSAGVHAEVSDFKAETEGTLGYGHGIV